MRDLERRLQIARIEDQFVEKGYTRKPYTDRPRAAESLDMDADFRKRDDANLCHRPAIFVELRYRFNVYPSPSEPRSLSKFDV
jgi:hypothetical protein